ncbi:MAG: 3D domain-containing protein [Candidatus Wallbacteria bacterium]|nr:3D domain-containing protein [Candidatus Wallbacteria bacterium]
MSRILMITALLAAAFTIQARGIMTMVSDFVEASQVRMALQACAKQIGHDPVELEAALQAEEDAAVGLDEILSAGDDVSAVAMGFILETYQGEALLCFARFLQGFSQGLENASKLGQKIKSAQNADFSAGDDQALQKQSGIILAPGAAVFNGPGFRTQVVDFLSSGAQVSIDAFNNGFYRVTDHGGNAGFVYGAYVEFHTPYAVEPGTGVSKAADAGLEPQLSAFAKMPDKKPTYYMTANEEGFPTAGYLYGKKYNGTEKQQVKTPSGQVIAATSGRFFAELLMQGSGLLSGGTGVSYVSNFRFNRIPDGCAGITATGYWVVPFHTLAVNRKEMPYGGVYYIPKTCGLKLPNGETHDGYWFAHDTGDAFQGATNRIDMYSYSKDWALWMETGLTPSHSKLTVYRVDSATKDRVYDKYRDQLGK